MKPMIGAPDAAASVTSLSVIPPTPECSTRARMSAVEMRLIAAVIASADPCTSALTTIGKEIAWFALDANMFSKSIGAAVVRVRSSRPCR